MPPKPSASKKRNSSKRLSEKIIPIYQMLSNKDIKEPLIDIMAQTQRTLKQDSFNLKLSFFKFLIKICGLEEYSIQTQSENTIQTLNDILEKAYQLKSTQITPLIIDTKNKFHNEFIKRIHQFLSSVMSEQIQVTTDLKVQFNQSFLVWLQILTKSKIRIVRSSSIQFTKIFVQQELKYYELYHQKKQSKKALNIAKNIGYYLEKIFSQRFNDIDQSIRHISFQMTQQILQSLESQIMTETLLNKIFQNLFYEDPLIIDQAIRLLSGLLKKCQNLKPLQDFLKDKLPSLVQLSRSAHFAGTNVQSLRIIESLHHQNPTSKLLNKQFLLSILQSFAPKNLLYGIHACIEVFYQSLYSSPEQMQLNSQVVLLEIINLLMGISDHRNIPIILKIFFVSTSKVQPQKIFNIDNMFTLLMSEYYRDENNNDIKLKQKQVAFLLTIISNWVKHCIESYNHLIKQKQVYEKILQSFNNHILMNCKDLFYEKMVEYQNISQKFLNLFTLIHTPTLAFNSLESYLNFVIEKSQKLFQEQLINCQVYGQIVNIFHNLSKDQNLKYKFHVKSLIGKIGVKKILDESSQLSQQQIFKISAILSKFPIAELTISDLFLNKLIKVFAESKQSKQRMKVLVIAHMIHHYNFMELFVNPSPRQVEIYKNSRNKILELYLQIINNIEQPASIRLSAFRNLTYTLKMISNSKFEQSPKSKIHAYQLTNEQMKTVYDYINSQLYQSDSTDYSSLDITKMLQVLSLEEQEVKTQIIRLLFDLYQNSYAFAFNAQSAKFIASLIKGQHDLQKQNFNLSPSKFDFSNQIQKRLNTLLQKYSFEEIKQSKLNQLIYWRLCFNLFNETRQDEKFDIILDKVLSIYFSKKKLDPETKKRLINKIMLFVMQGVDYILSKKQYIKLDIYENLLRKINRKIQKETLIKIKMFYIEKTQGIQSPYVKSFLQTWQSITRVNIKHPKKLTQKEKQGQQDSEKESQKSVQNEQQNEIKKRNRVQNNKTKNKNIRSQRKDTSRIMQIEQSDNDDSKERMKYRNSTSKEKNRRVTTRSGTKRKV